MTGSAGFVAAALPSGGAGIAAAAGILVGLAALVSIAWYVRPALLACGAVVLAPFAGNWQQLGIPGAIAPDRVLLVLALGVALLRVLRGDLRLVRPLGGIHVVLALLAVYVVASAAAAGTLTDKESLLRILEAFGILPFLLFTLGPAIFSTSRDRDLLLAALVGLGAYLGLTVLFETVGLDALVFPKYILDPNYGIHVGRGRGPFADAVANGFGLYVCALAATMAALRWTRTVPRLLALAVVLLCAIGTLETLERSVWLGAAVATIVVLVSRRSLRPYALPTVALAAVAVAAALFVVPGLRGKTEDRAADKGPVWDRRNLTTAALNMVEERPIAGWGWASFKEHSQPYFRIAETFPLTATAIDLHSFYLTYAVELGLIGLALWLLAVFLAIARIVSTRYEGDLDAWKSGFIALTVFFLIGAAFVPSTVFQNLCFWLWAGVMWGARDGRGPEPVVG